MAMTLWLVYGGLVTYLALGGCLLTFCGETKFHLAEGEKRAYRVIGLLRAASRVLCWPVTLLLRRGNRVPCPPPFASTAARLYGAAIFTVTFLLLALLPAIFLSAAPARGNDSLSDELASEAASARWLVAYGQLFPSVPVNIYLAKGIDHFGLRIEMIEGKHVPPSALYWASSLDSRGEPAGKTVFLGTVGGTRNLWIPLFDASMRASGYWVIYVLPTNTTEARQAQYRLEGKTE